VAGHAVHHHPVSRRAGLALLALAMARAPLAGAEDPLEAVPPPSALDGKDCAVLAALDFTEAVGAAVKVVAAPVAADAEGPARCRVTATVAPETGVEVWLPVDGWNGKLFVAGCYGLCGSIRTDQFADAAARGYATATTDGGHSDARYPDSRWALDNTALEDDFGHRAVHVSALLARALVEAYYGDAAAHAYFRGCSTGGRQALVAATRYPEDFDGIIAGAPFHPLLSVPHMIWADRANTGPDGKPLLRARELGLLQRAVLAACDGADGLADGIVGDPEGCAFDPAALACGPDADAESCLAPAQVAAARAIYQGPVDGAGRSLAPGAARGGEGTWAAQLIGRDGRPPFFRTVGQNWMRYHAFEPDPAQPGPLVFDFDRDPARLAPAAARAGFTTDLEAFAARDGRLIAWHGWADESLQPAHTLQWWRDALAANGGAADVARFARLFMLPGVQHCGGGPGAGDVDWLAALEGWVERDEAPDMLVAWRTKDSTPATTRPPRFPPVGEVVLKRPLFPYPAVARYRGEGDALDPASWAPALPAAPASPPASPAPPPAPPRTEVTP